MVITKNGFVDMGNGLFLNKDIIISYDERTRTAYTRTGEQYVYGEFMKTTPYLCEECFDSQKGDYYYFKKVGSK